MFFYGLIFCISLMATAWLAYKKGYEKGHGEIFMKETSLLHNELIRVMENQAKIMEHQSSKKENLNVNTRRV